jgi:3',5'-cyclic AMP phosphodiesterase CpdA
MLRVNRRQLLVGAGSAVAVSALSPRLMAAPAEDSFQFLFITDCHIEPEFNAAGGTDSAFKKARTIKADFTIQGGDHVFDAGAVSKERASSLFDLYARTEQDLGMKVYHTIGNHDCLGIIGTAVSPGDPQYGKKMYEERFGKTCYSFDHKHCHFVVLDSINPLPGHAFEGRIDGRQLAWLANDLAKVPTGAPIIVVTHIPLVTAVAAYIAPSSPMHKYIPLLSVANSAEVIDVFKGHNVIAVLQGHAHINEIVLWKGVPYITSGAVCGNWWHGPYLDHPEGFTVVSVTGGKVTTRYETYGFKSVDPQADYGYKAS